MKQFMRSKSGRALIAAVVLSAGAAGTVVTTAPTHASLTATKNIGPLFTVSNSHTIQTIATVNDTQGNVKEIDYLVHGPAGTALARTKFGRAWSKLPIKARYYADQAAGTYTITAQVVTATSTTASVTAQTTVANLATGARGSISVSGHENAPLTGKLNG